MMNTHQSPSVSLGVVLLCLLMSFGIVTPAWASEQNAIRAPVDASKKKLSIKYSISNAAYRQQILALTPLGSSYEQVRAFARSELQVETHPSDQFLDPAIFGERNTPKYIEIETLLHRVSFGSGFLFRDDEVRDQPPYAKKIVTDLGLINGTEYIEPNFQAKPFPLGPWIDVRVIFVLDHKRKLADVYCFAGGRHVVVP